MGKVSPGVSMYARTNKVGLKLLIIALKEAEAEGKGLSYEDMVELTGFSQRTLSHWIATFKRPPFALVRIISWGHDIRGHVGVPEFAWNETGKKKDVSKPVKPRAEITACYRARKKYLQVLHATVGEQHDRSVREETTSAPA